MIKFSLQFLFNIYYIGLFLLQLECKKIILTSPLPPLINCNIGEIGNNNFSGFEIDLIKEIINQQKLEDLEFECSQPDNWQSKIIDTDKYIGYAGHLQIDYKYNNQGILFSQPYWNTGLSILTYRYTDQWQFLNVFSVEIYLLIATTSLILGFLTFFLEKFEEPLENYLWNSFSNTFFISTINLKRQTSKLIQIGFWFLILMVTSSYTAHLTVIIYKNNQNILNSHQLNQMIVSTTQKYNNILNYFGAKVYNNIDERADNLKIYDVFQNNQLPVDAVVIEDFFAKASAYSSCELYIQQRMFYQTGYALAYSINQDSILIQNFNQAIQELTDSGFVEKKLNNYISGNYIECQKSDSTDQINFKSIGGLFIVQGIATAVAIVCFIFTKLPIYNIIMVFLKQNNIVPREREIPKFGDELVAENLKKTIKKIAEAQQTSIEKRMDLLDNRVMEFYQLLLNEEDYRKQNFIKKQIENIDNLLIESDKTKQDDTSNTKTEKSINGQNNSLEGNSRQEDRQISERKEESVLEEEQAVNSDGNQSESSDSKSKSSDQKDPSQINGQSLQQSPREDPGLINVSNETPRSINLQQIHDSQ